MNLTFMPHQINLKVTTSDKVYFLRNNKIQSGLIHTIRIALHHVPVDWNKNAECKVVIEVFITIDKEHLNIAEKQNEGFYRTLDQVFYTKEELVQDLINKP